MEIQDKAFNTICRVCLGYEKPDKMVSLTDISHETGLSLYGLSFEEITKISVNQNQFLPVNLCEKCKESLEGVSKFIVASKISDRKLQKLIQFSLKEDLDGAMVKEVIRQYTLFSQNYLEDSGASLNHPSTSKRRNPKNKDEVPEIKEEIEIKENSESNDYDSPCESYGEQAQSEIDNVDIFIDSIKKLVTSQIDNNKDAKEIIENDNTTQQDLETKPDKKVEANQGFVCNICQRVLATAKTFKYHIERHKGCKFVCDQCGKGFPTKAELVQHQIHRHNAVSNYECDICSYRAVQKIQLIEHIRLHTGERPFTCETCGLTFRRKTLYVKHTKSHGEPTIQCDMCPRKFFIRSSMLTHMNSRHKREYIFTCSICNIGYAKARSVKKHMLDKHGIPRHMQGTVKKTYKNVNECTTFKKSKEDGKYTYL